ncbi:MAG: PEP-CTERM sorting domain-containing protein [Sphingobium sp.]
MKRKLVPLSVLVVASIAVPAGIGLGGLTGVAPGGMAAVAAILRDPASIFADRSPGARADGALFQTKNRVASNAVGPRERVLSAGRERPADFVPEAPAAESPLGDAASSPRFIDTTPGPAPFFAGPTFTPPMPERQTGGGPPPGGGTPPGGGGTPPGGGGTPPGGGGTPPVDPPTSPPTTPPEVPPVGVVPEPATWIMLMAGFFGLGAIMRRARRADRASGLGHSAGI